MTTFEFGRSDRTRGIVNGRSGRTAGSCALTAAILGLVFTPSAHADPTLEQDWNTLLSDLGISQSSSASSAAAVSPGSEISTLVNSDLLYGTSNSESAIGYIDALQGDEFNVFNADYATDITNISNVISDVNLSIQSVEGGITDVTSILSVAAGLHP